MYVKTLSKMLTIVSLVFLISDVHLSEDSDFPRFLQRCNLTTVNLCVQAQYQDTMLFLKNGNAEMKLPVLDPYKCQNIKIENREFTVNFPELEIQGITVGEMKKFNFDHSKMTGSFSINFRQLIIGGHGSLQTYFLFTSVSGIGDIRFILGISKAKRFFLNEKWQDDVTVHSSLQFLVKTNNKRSYLAVKNLDIRYEPNRFSARINNLLGNDLLDTLLMRRINTNWGYYNRLASGDIKTFINEQLTAIINVFLTNIPY